VSRGKPAVIRDPAVAIAAAKCWMARWQGKRSFSSIAAMPDLNKAHPDECGFCEYPPDYLMQALEEFVEWAGFKSSDTNLELAQVRTEIEAFTTLPPEMQAEAVRRAQGYL
jgi:hypothetical protein